MAEQPREDRRQRVIDDHKPAKVAIVDARMVEMLADGPNPGAGSVPQHGIRQCAELLEDGFALLVQQVQVSHDGAWHKRTSSQNVIKVGPRLSGGASFSRRAAPTVPDGRAASHIMVVCCRTTSSAA